MKTKNSDPAAFLGGKSIEPITLLYFHLNHLKQMYRQGWLRQGRDIPERQCESVADHIFGVSMLGLLVSELYFPNLDRLKIVTMCLIHELGEIINGDPRSPQNEKSRRRKHVAERAAIKTVMKGFPGGEKYLALWEEFEKGKSSEAKLVRQLDKLEMAFQAKIYSLQHKKNLQEFLDDVRTHLTSRELKKLLVEIEDV